MTQDAKFGKLEGVTSTRVGYTGGSSPNPTYESVCSGDGHTEAVKVEFNPQQLPYNDLLKVQAVIVSALHSPPLAVWPRNAAKEGWRCSIAIHLQVFFKEHDPTISKGKAQYKSAIWYHSDDQKQIAEQMIKRISSTSSKPVATDLAPATQWTDAEEYHQKYYSRSGM